MPPWNPRHELERGASERPNVHHATSDPELSPEELAVAGHYTPAPWWFKIFDAIWIVYFVLCTWKFQTEPRMSKGSPDVINAMILLGISLLWLILVSVAQNYYAKRSGNPRMRFAENYRLLGFVNANFVLAAIYLPPR